MITNDGKAKIMDFGLAKVGKGSQVTKIGSTVGTIAYMSPEQARGEELDHRTDIWSFGVVLYEMLTGKQPFKGDYDQAVIYSILNEELETINNISTELNTIINKTLSKDPESRYQRVSEMLSDLIQLKNEPPSKTFSYSTQTKSLSKKKNKKWFVPAAIIIFITFIITAYIYFNNLSGENETTSERKMIVVLPFENLGISSDDYFADGITEEMTSKLSSIGEIGVISSKSAQKLANSNKSPYEIGKELGVDYVLQGSVRWAKNEGNKSRVRITPQLIHITDNTVAWSNSYDRVLDDIFTVQNEIAQKVVDQLSGSLVSDKIEKISPPTKNLKAYDYYLQGLSYENRGGYSKSDVENAINLYKKALELDPDFAQAYASLSKNKSGLFWFFYDRNEKNVEEAYHYAEKSFALNPDLAEVHLAFGYYHYWCKLNYTEAIKEFSKVLRIQPNNSEAYFGIGVVYRRMGDFDLSLQNQLKAYSLDPLSFEIGRNIAETYGLIRDYANAENYYNRVIELNPDRSYPKVEIALNYISWKGDLKTAYKIFNQVNENDYLDIMKNAKIYLQILNRDFNKAINELNSTNLAYETSQFRYTPRTQQLGFLYKFMNEPLVARTYFDSSIVEIQKKLKENPDDERLYSSLGISYAGLGTREKAIAEGEKGINLLPIKKEAYRGYYREWDMVIIYTLLGDYNTALKKIDFILSIPGEFSVNQLRLDPLYDPLRNLPGYKTILAKYK